MTILEIDPKTPNALTTVLHRVAGPFKVVRRGGEVVARQLPPTVHAAEAGTKTASSAVQRMSDSTLHWLAVGSLGLGAGLYVSGKRRLTIAAGLAPALVAGVTMALRHDSEPDGSTAGADRPAEPPTARA
jgi:hypothetical protein